MTGKEDCSMAVFGRVRKQAKVGGVGEGSETSLFRTRALLRLRRSEVRSAKPPCYAGYRQPKKTMVTLFLSATLNDHLGTNNMDNVSYIKI